jgi:hypothetical protein
MKLIIRAILFVFVGSFSLFAQTTTFQDTLLEKMKGNWILKGTIGGQETTHDVAITWILDHQYLQLHEVSREKYSDGKAAYEALVLIGWDAQLNKYACLWLDVTSGGGLRSNTIAHAERSGNKIPFLFIINEKRIFHTTFIYDKNSGTWQWLMDDEDNGKVEPFARVTLTKDK